MSCSTFSSLYIYIYIYIYKEDPKQLKVKNWEEIAKDRRTGRDLAEKEKTHK